MLGTQNLWLSQVVLLGGPTGVPANAPEITFESDKNAPGNTFESDTAVPGRSGKDLWKTAKVKVRANKLTPCGLCLPCFGG